MLLAILLFLTAPGLAFNVMSGSSSAIKVHNRKVVNRTPPTSPVASDVRADASLPRGTISTAVISTAVCSVASLPALVTSPVVFNKLLEVAALSRVGVTPLEMLEKTGALW
eukprot:5841528-Prymnesium_polylepis.1